MPVVTAEAKPATINPTVKPRMATSLKIEKKEFDTNKLPLLPVKAESFDIHTTTPEDEIEQIEKTEIKLIAPEEIFEEDVETEENEDLAPFAMRFNAGLFDLIIGSFLSLILLTPFMISGGNWFTMTGFLAFARDLRGRDVSLYDRSIGLYGRTFGMRLFSLEVVDIEGEELSDVSPGGGQFVRFIFYRWLSAASDF